MIELRWKKVGQQPPVLEYRIQHTSVSTSGILGVTMRDWSDWMQVPTLYLIPNKEASDE